MTNTQIAHKDLKDRFIKAYYLSIAAYLNTPSAWESIGNEHNLVNREDKDRLDKIVEKVLAIIKDDKKWEIIRDDPNWKVDWSSNEVQEPLRIVDEIFYYKIYRSKLCGYEDLSSFLNCSEGTKRAIAREAKDFANQVETFASQFLHARPIHG